MRTVLAHIGDATGASRAAEIRTAVITGLLESSDAGSASTDQVAANANQANTVEPADATQLQKAPSDAGPHDERAHLYGAVPWAPWVPVVVGEQDDLDSMRTNRVKENVRSLIEDIAEAEGPVHQDRLARLVGLGFGFSRLAPARMKRILGQVSKASVTVDAEGFVWPGGIDHSQWLIHRTGDDSIRPIEQISPVEIANAMTAVVKDDASVSGAEMQRRTLQQFGRKRATKAVKAQLELGLALAKATGRI